MIFLLRALETSRATKHIQVAHCVRFVLIFDTQRVRHDSFDQQQCPMARQSLATIFEDCTTSCVIPVVNYTFEDDGIGDRWNRFEEVASQEARPITDAHTLKMFVRCCGAPGKIKNRPPISSPDPPPTSIR